MAENVVELWQVCRVDPGPGTAAEVADRMLEKDPELLTQWHQTRLRVALIDWIRYQERQARQADPGAFDRAARQFEEDGNVRAFVSAFQRTHGAVPGKFMGEYRREDVRLVIDDYKQTKKEADFSIRVWTRVYDRIGDRAIQQVYTEEEFTRLFVRRT